MINAIQYDKNDIDSILLSCNKENENIYWSYLDHNLYYNSKILTLIPDASFLIKWIKKWEPYEMESIFLFQYLNKLEYNFIAPYILYSELAFVTNRVHISKNNLDLYIGNICNKNNLKYYCWDYTNMKNLILEISKSKWDNRTVADITDCVYHAIATILWWYFITSDKAHYNKVWRRYQDTIILLQDWEKIKNI